MIEKLKRKLEEIEGRLAGAKIMQSRNDIFGDFVELLEDYETTIKLAIAALENDGNVYEFMYNSDCCESSSHTMSVHKSKKGAEMAMEFHKNEVKVLHEKLWEGENPEFTWDYDQAWQVRKTDLKD